MPNRRRAASMHAPSAPPIERRSTRRTLDEFESKRLLAQFGVVCATELRADSVAEAVAAAERIGFPVVVKGCGEAFAHKTELGLVAVGLTSADAVRLAAERMLVTMDGGGRLLVQQMVSGERELLVGMKRDAQFGPVVTFGLGGIFAEVLADISLRVAPLSRADAHAMLDEIRAARILGALRGMPAVDREGLVDTLVAVGDLALARPDISEIDINPLIVAGRDAVAVDALVVIDDGL